MSAPTGGEMPGLDRVPANVRTVYLGQFTPDHAATIAHELEARGIVWWSKEPGGFTRLWEFGVRLFVDREKLTEARALAAEVSAGDAGA